MKKSIYLIFLLLSTLVPLYGQNRPFVTEFVDTVEKDKARLELGFEFFQDAKFRLSGLEGDLSRLGVFGLRIGAGDRVEIQVLGSVQDFLNIERRFPAPLADDLDFSGNSTSAFGDLILGTKVQMVREKPGWPGLGFRLAVQLPNASNESGLGVDETNVFSSFLLQKRVRDLTVLLNLGLALLGDPLDGGAQDDLLSYGIGLRYSAHPRFNLLSDFYGRTGPGGIGTEEQARLRFGTQILAAGLSWDIAGMVGLRDTDPDVGVIFGISKDIDFPLFR